MPVDSYGRPLPKLTPQELLKSKLKNTAYLPKASSGIAAVQPVKHVSFDKDLISQKMEFFTDLVTHFNSLKNHEAGGAIAEQAKHWLARQMASDIFSTLHLDKFKWEFEAASSRSRKPAQPAADPLDSIILKEPVFEFLRKTDNEPDNSLPLEYDTGVLFNMDITEDILNAQKKDDEATKRLKTIQAKLDAQDNSRKIKPTGKIIPEPKVEPGEWRASASEMYKRFTEPEDPRQLFRIDFTKLQEGLMAKIAKHEADAKKSKRTKKTKKKTATKNKKK